jgi:hypothetical protein
MVRQPLSKLDHLVFLCHAMDVVVSYHEDKSRITRTACSFCFVFKSLRAYLGTGYLVHLESVFRIRMFLGHPDPIAQGTDPSTIKQNIKNNP